MKDQTTLPVELSLEESGMLYHMLLQRFMEEEKSKAVSALLTEDVCMAIRRREIALLKKIAKVNDELRR